MIRTTIELPEDLHSLLSSIARDRSQSLSATVMDVVQRGPTHEEVRAGLERSPATGLLVMSGIDRPITHEDVRALEDEE